MNRGIRYLALSSLWLVPILFLTLAFVSEWTVFWNGVLVPSWKGPFMDLSSISRAVEVQQHGGDPLVSFATDVYQRPINYPRIWLHLFSGMHITRARTPLAGILFCVLYLICISWLMVRAANWQETLLLLVAGLSLAPWLAIERGNTDLVVFALLFFGVASGNRYARPGTYFLGALLKLFPIVALGIDIVRRPAKERTGPAVFLGLAVALLAWQWRDLIVIRRGTPVSTYLSYGLLSLKAQASYLSAGLLAASCITALGILIVVWLSRPNFDDAVLRSKSSELFLVFGGIYAFTFAIGSNWNYRLIFLLPTLPFAMELVRTKNHARWAITYIAAVLVAENSFGLGTYEGIPLGDVATFTLFVMMVVVFLPIAGRFLAEAGAHFLRPANAALSNQKASL
ncbi:MAG TPA: hypothetical protein VE263_01185 [Candidatus Angelobacter sp.]|nr:hypothetical protein [Candidatus Angelobacter sp.]